MIKYKKIYCDAFGYTEGDFIPSELSGSVAVDLHHINGRGKGKDVVENLIALTREEHNDAHSEKISKAELTAIHLKFMKKNKVLSGNSI